MAEHYQTPGADRVRGPPEAGDFHFIASSVSGVDGIGVVGGAHRPDERMDLASLGLATARAAVLHRAAEEPLIDRVEPSSAINRRRT